MSTVIQQVVSQSLFPYAELEEHEIALLAEKNAHLTEDQLLKKQDLTPLCDMLN
jgi:hypothetical protein